MKCEFVRCSLCDEFYSPGTPRAAVHEHPEPQSGQARADMAASGLDYDRWVIETAEGRQWFLERLTLGV